MIFLFLKTSLFCFSNRNFDQFGLLQLLKCKQFAINIFNLLSLHVELSAVAKMTSALS